jgi:hypothetical protein
MLKFIRFTLLMIAVSFVLPSVCEAARSRVKVPRAATARGGGGWHVHQRGPGGVSAHKARKYAANPQKQRRAEKQLTRSLNKQLPKANRKNPDGSYKTQVRVDQTNGQYVFLKQTPLGGGNPRIRNLGNNILAPQAIRPHNAGGPPLGIAPPNRPVNPIFGGRANAPQPPQPNLPRNMRPYGDSIGGPNQ